jgi:hypothetical protein
MDISTGGAKAKWYGFSSVHDDADSNDACLLSGDPDSYDVAAASIPRAPALSAGQPCTKYGGSPYWEASDKEAVSEAVEPLAEARAGGKWLSSDNGSSEYIAPWSMEPTREDA